MEDLQFKTGEFEGPLDLLLFFITKHKLDILTVEISILFEQFMEYINELHSRDLEVTSSFLEMAAKLVYIKTVSLLPSPEEAETLKAELQGQLLELSIVKTIADKLFNMNIGQNIFVRKPMKFNLAHDYKFMHDPSHLTRAYEDAAGKKSRRIPPSPEVFSPLVAKRKITVISKVITVLRMLYKNQRIPYDEFFRCENKSEIVATFLAMLELIKSNRIQINDAHTYVYLGVRK